MKFFLCGPSKSGKTTLSSHVAFENVEVEHVRVSHILRKANVVLPVPTLTDGLANQKIALKELTSYSSEKKHVVIDGHAVIETLEGPLIVPDAFFEVLQPDAIIFIDEKPETLVLRRGFSSTAAMISETLAFSHIEWNVCKRIASRLKVNLHHLRSPSHEEFSRLIRRLLSFSS